VQKSFLRVLQEHRFRPVGGAQEVTSDFRLVAATNRDLDAMVELWQFRQDLLYRVRAVTIDLPPLRDRTGDVESLCRHFLDRHSRKTGTPMKKVSPELWGALLEYDWPGNVRELFNALESAVAAAGSEPMLFPSHLPVRIRASIVRSSVAESLKEAEPAQPTFAPDPDDFPTLKDHRATVLAEVERQYLEELLRITDSNVKRACELSGLSRARLYALMKQHGVSR
jgi:transcriptional regulator with PAS, ATPase and Fis domain